MIWGHDGGGTGAWLNQQVPSGFERLDRSWRIDKTGVIGKAELLVLENDLPFSNEHIGLLVAEDSAFTQGVYAYQLVPDRDTLEGDLFIPDDAYFTFVTGPESSFQQYTPINEIQDAQFVLYPNPTSEFVKVASLGEGLSNASLQLRVFDLTGRLVTEMPLEANREAILDLQGLASGSYQVTVTGGQFHWAEKVVKY
jgi:hypothetical protein